MKKSIILASVIVSFAGLIYAQNNQPAAQPAEAPKAEQPKQAPKAEHKAMHKAEKKDVFIGKISAIDTTKNEITVKNEKNAEKTVAVDAKEIANYKEGMKVKITTKGDKTEVKVIKEAKKEHKAAKKAEMKKEEAPKAAETPKAAEAPKTN
jgi:hypothetical protein